VGYSRDGKSREMSKKHIRKLHIDDKDYIWSISSNVSINYKNDYSIITLVGTNFSRLYVNHISHDFEIRPQSFVNAIRIARDLGWQPEKNSGDLYLLSKDGIEFLEKTKENEHLFNFTP